MTKAERAAYARARYAADPERQRERSRVNQRRRRAQDSGVRAKDAAASKAWVARQKRDDPGEYKRRRSRYAKAYFARHREAILARNRSARAADLGGSRAKGRARSAAEVGTCADNYVKALLVKGTDLRARELPQTLVELKRACVLLHRELKGNQ